jgi:hypothetical protein
MLALYVCMYVRNPFSSKAKAYRARAQPLSTSSSSGKVPPMKKKMASPSTPPVAATSSKAKAAVVQSPLGRVRAPPGQVRAPLAPPAPPPAPPAAAEEELGHPQCRNGDECVGHAGSPLYTHISFTAADDRDRERDVYCRGCIKYWQENDGVKILIFKPVLRDVD